MRRLVLVVMLLGSVCVGCGQGMPATTHTGSDATVGMSATVFASPTGKSTPPIAAAAPDCALILTGAARSSSPTAVGSSTSPTPKASGPYHQLTFAQAQRVAPFHLAQPAWLPPCLNVAGITASVLNLTDPQPQVPATPTTSPVQAVRLDFGTAWPNKVYPVVIDELEQGTPLWPIPGQVTPLTTTLTIGGHTVTRLSWAIVATLPPPGADAAYIWADQGTTFRLSAVVGATFIGIHMITEQDVEQMIASMLQ